MSLYKNIHIKDITFHSVSCKPTFMLLLLSDYFFFIFNRIIYYIPYNLGVPQGSSLGPVIFAVFINEILNNANTYLYADDTIMLFSNPAMTRLE